MAFNNEISITYMSGPLDGKTLAFSQPEPGEERVLLIGRRDGCHINLNFDSQASRLHAKLICLSVPVTATESVEDPYTLAFFLEDGGSRNGTFVERENRAIQGRVNVSPGMLFRVGRTWMRLDVPLTFGSRPF